MLYLIVGILIWSLIHFIPTYFFNFRKKIINITGENPYKGIFSLLIVISIVLMVIGWRTSSAETIYSLPETIAHPITFICVTISFLLFFSGRIKSRIIKYIHNPQLVAVITWGVGHIISNINLKAIILFGGLVIWAIISIIQTNHRDAKIQKNLPEKFSIKSDILNILVGLVALCIFIFLHPFISGVKLV
ncbi:NnrU family protein [Francisella sp. SYW-9]|uniref:NnrU family protein n=1 Tax=Francisella sp. SYW-9 TaxID=2610888 RepID=UPI00123D2EED|nr:NnrU family protein [Francisella sp. SYW-9]